MRSFFYEVKMDQNDEKTGEIVLYQPEGAIKLEVRVENETVWLTQAQMGKLFERERSVIAKHIGNIFKEKELDEKVMCKFCTILFQSINQ